MTIKLTITAETVDELRDKLRRILGDAKGDKAKLTDEQLDLEIERINQNHRQFTEMMRTSHDMSEQANATLIEKMQDAKNGWIPWNGGPCPAAIGQRVQVKFRDGSLWEPRSAGDWRWEHHGTVSDIIAYRVIDK